jgi:hypothetical protein
MDDNPSNTFRFRDALPHVCVLCGAPAAPRSSAPVGLPEHATVKRNTWVQLISFIFGFGFFWDRATADRPENQWVALPSCGHHSGPGVVARVVSLRAINKHTVEIFGACPAFRHALELHNAPPTAEFLEAIDRGPATNAEDFLGQIDKSTVDSPGDFLKKMGQKRDAT